jgi:hypothetical protein
MRAKGVSIRGLREATGLSKDAIIRYTSPEVWEPRKWTDAALAYLDAEYPKGTTLEDLASEINRMLGRTDITPHAVQVKVGQRKLLRNEPNNEARIEAIRRYWRTKTNKSVDNTVAQDLPRG